MSTPTPVSDLDERVVQARNPHRFDGGRLGQLVNVLCVAAVIGFLLVVSAGRVDHAPPSWLIATVTLLPYLLASGLGSLFCVWVFLPDSRVPPFLITALSISGLALWGPGWSVHDSSEVGEPVRILSWNLRRLWGGPDDGGDAVQCVIDAIRAADPQLVSLQEVSADDIAALSKVLDLDCAHTTYLPGGGSSKGGLASCTLGGDWSLRSGGAQSFSDDWRYVFSEVERGDVVFNVLTVHLHPYELGMRRWIEVTRHGEAVQQAQSDQTALLLERVAKFADPTLVAGDFNSTRDAALHVSLREHLYDAWELGGVGFGGTVKLMGVAPLRVDYVYATRDFTIHGSRVPGVGCSDHQPVVSELVLHVP